MTSIEWLNEQMNNIKGSSISMNGRVQFLEIELNNLLNQAKAMEKEQMKDAFVECWKSNVPDGVECKLDAEQYYTETYESNT